MASGASYGPEISSVTVTNSGLGACVNLGGVSGASVHDNDFKCATGLIFQGYTNRIQNNAFFPNPSGVFWAGIVMDCGDCVNSNHIWDNGYTGVGGTGVFARGGYANKFDGKEDLEDIGLGYYVAGPATEIHGPYMENFSPTVAWAASTQYGLGAVIKDSNNNGELCVTAGMSGGSAPSWSVTEGGTTTESSPGTAVWMMYNPGGLTYSSQAWPAGWGILIGPTTGDAVVDGSGGLANYVFDLAAAVNGIWSNHVYTNGNLAWGVKGQAPNTLSVKPYPGLLFTLFSEDNTQPSASLNFKNWLDTDYGLQLDLGGNLCTISGSCGHAPLHVGLGHFSAGIQDFGPVSVNALPTPAAPTLTVVGTPGTTSATYYVVAHCAGGVTLPSAGATITNAPNSLGSGNYVAVQTPATYTFTDPLRGNSYSDSWSTCSWDILKGSTSLSLTTNAWLPSGVYNDQGGSTTAYSAPPANTTGPLSVAGKITQQGGSAVPITVASGSLALATSQISSPGCQAVSAGSVNSASAPGVLTTDVIEASFNGDPTGVTGYVPATTGMLTIIPYPTAGYVNFNVCNNTSSPITPGAITLNWRVTR
jgi:hypothetical protein